MKTCPICHKPVPGRECENCGYDLSGDFIAFRTLSPVSEADRELLKTRRELAATKIKPAPKSKWWIALIPVLALVLLFASREKPEPPEPTPVVTVMPAPTPEPDIYFRYKAVNGGITITGYEGELPAELVLPEEFKGNRVKAIGESAFADCDGLTSVTIPEGVERIEREAFTDCDRLASLTLPESLTSIGDYAFYGGSCLKSVTIPESVTFIGDSAFRDTQWYDHQTDPGGFVIVGDSVLLKYCGTDSKATIPNGVKSISGWAFSDCANLKNITIPEGVTSIGDWAFYECVGLTSVTIPASVKSIGGWAFFDCANLKSITIPESVTSIGYYAFGACSGLKNISVETGNRLYSSQDGILFDKAKTTLVCWPAGRSGSYEIPKGVAYIDDGAFGSCEGLTALTIPDSVTVIRSFAFNGCYKLTNVTIPDSVEFIGLNAFYGCSGLKSVTIPANCQVDESSFPSSCTVTRRELAALNIQPTPEPTPAPTPTPAPESWPPYPLASTNIVPPSDASFWLAVPQKRIVTAKKGAYQFATPDDHAERFSTVAKGTVVEMLAQEGAFGLCLYGGQILGWVRVEWLDVYA